MSLRLSCSSSFDLAQKHLSIVLLFSSSAFSFAVKGAVIGSSKLLDLFTELGPPLLAPLIFGVRLYAILQLDFQPRTEERWNWARWIFGSRRSSTFDLNFWHIICPLVRDRALFLLISNNTFRWYSLPLFYFRWLTNNWLLFLVYLHKPNIWGLTKPQRKKSHGVKSHDLGGQLIFEFHEMICCNKSVV